MKEHCKTVIAIGTNVGDRFNNISQAITMLESYHIKLLKLSSIYKNKALLPEDAPQEWDMDFFNCVSLMETTLKPDELLQILKTIETTMGRVKRGKWGPREIDLDIICYENLVLNTPELIIPHPHLQNRDFVYIPLAEVWPEWTHPVLKEFSTAKQYSALHQSNLELIK